MTDRHTFPVGLEEGADGATRIHSFSLPGCTAEGATRDEALAAFPRALAGWLHALAAAGEPLPPAGAELEVHVEEWVRTQANVAAGESDVTFEDDLRPLSAEEATALLHRLGDLRRRLLERVRGLRPQELDAERPGGWTVRGALDELARAQWWLLTRLGASPLAEVPERTLGRLDTAMALVVQQFTTLGEEQRAAVLELDGEVWTARKVLRRLLAQEWALGELLQGALRDPAEGRV